MCFQRVLTRYGPIAIVSFLFVSGVSVFASNILSAPTNLTAACSPSGAQVTLTWDPTPGATKYQLRVNDPTNDGPSCVYGGNPTDNWYCPATSDVRTDAGLVATTYTTAVIPNRQYHWWLVATDGVLGGLTAVGQPFMCSTPATESSSCTETITPAAVASGETFTDTWTSTNASSMTLVATRDGVAVVGPGPTGVNGSYQSSWTVPGTYNYTRTVTGINGSGTCSATLGVGVPEQPVEASMLTNERLSIGSSYTPDARDCGKTLALGGAVHQTLTVSHASINNPSCAFLVLNEYGGGTKTVALDNVSMRLYPLQSMIVFNQNGTWFTQRSDRWKLAGDLTIYVAPDGDNTNDGLSASSPFKDVAFALNEIMNNYDLGLQNITIQLADGVYSNGVHYSSIPPGAGIGHIVIQGNATNPSAVVISSIGTDAIGDFVGTTLVVRNLKVETHAGGHCIYASYGARILLSNIVFGDCTYAQIMADKQSYVEVNGDYKIAGSASSHMTAIDSGMIKISDAHVTIVEDLVFQGFAGAADLGLIKMRNMTFSGAAGVQGKRYQVYGNSVITTGTSDELFFPGNEAGSKSGGGVYN